MPLIDIREHGGVFGGRSATVKFVKVTYSLTEPANPEENEIWIKHEGNVNKLYFQETQPSLVDDDLFIKVIAKEQIAKATQIKQGNKILPVTPETPSINANKIAETDYFDVYGYLGLVRYYKNGNIDILDAFQRINGTWKAISAKNSFIIQTLTNDGIKKLTLDGEILVQSNAVNNASIYVSANPILNELAVIDPPNKIKILDLDTLELKRTISFGASLYCLDYTPDGYFVVADMPGSSNRIYFLDPNGNTVAYTNFSNGTVSYWNAVYDKYGSGLIFIGSNVPRVWNKDTQQVDYYTAISGTASSMVSLSSDNTVVYSYRDNYLYGRFTYTTAPTLTLVQSVAMPTPEISACLGAVSDYSGDVFVLGYSSAVNPRPVFVYKYDKNGSQVKKVDLRNYADTTNFGFTSNSNLTMRLTPNHLIIFTTTPRKVFVFDRNTLDLIATFDVPSTYNSYAGSIYPQHHLYNHLW